MQCASLFAQKKQRKKQNASNCFSPRAADLRLSFIIAKQTAIIVIKSRDKAFHFLLQGRALGARALIQIQIRQIRVRAQRIVHKKKSEAGWRNIQYALSFLSAKPPSHSKLETIHHSIKVQFEPACVPTPLIAPEPIKCASAKHLINDLAQVDS